MVHHLVAPAIETDISCYLTKKPHTIADHLVNELCHIYHQLDHLDSLVPCDHVNTLFTKLVTLCTFQYDQDTVAQVLSDIRIKSILSPIRMLASQGEYFLELFWARSLVKENTPNLSRFVYYQNYVDLVQLELHALQGVGANLNNIVFIGSGPLPLSSILMFETLRNRNSGIMVNNIDRDQESIAVSTNLLKKLGIDCGFKQYVMEASQYSGFGQADVVVLGALVGSDIEEKMEFLTKIGNCMEKGSFIMVRSAHSLRKLLYPSVEPYQVNMCGFETAIVLHPFNDVVNSVLIAKKV